MSDPPRDRPDPDTEKLQIEKLLTMIRRFARRRCGSHPDYDDVVQTGALAAAQVIKKYDPAKNDSIEGFGWLRVRGAMLDYLRRNQSAPIEPWRASMRRAGGEVAEARHDEGDVLTDTDEVTQGHIDSAAGGIAAAMALAFLSGDDVFIARRKYAHAMAMLEESMARLSRGHAQILDLRWWQKLEFEPIAGILRVSLPTAHRRHTKAIKRLGSLLRARGLREAPPLDGICP